MAGYEEDFSHPYVTVDVVILTVRDGELGVVVHRREDEEPRGWVLPGAFVKVREKLNAAALRVIRDPKKLGFKSHRWREAEEKNFIPLRPFDEIRRDSRRRVITLPRLHLVDWNVIEGDLERTPASVALAEARLEGESLTVEVGGEDTVLVFDHHDILKEAIGEARRRVLLDDPSIYAELLPEEFTVRQLQEVHEAVLGQRVNKDSFRRRIADGKRLVATGKFESGVDHRPAELHRWAAGHR